LDNAIAIAPKLAENVQANNRPTAKKQTKAIALQVNRKKKP